MQHVGFWRLSLWSVSRSLQGCESSETWKQLRFLEPFALVHIEAHTHTPKSLESIGLLVVCRKKKQSHPNLERAQIPSNPHQKKRPQKMYAHKTMRQIAFLHVASYGGTCHLWSCVRTAHWEALPTSQEVPPVLRLPRLVLPRLSSI
eukprot:6479663-Amphidinium_carterae.2